MFDAEGALRFSNEQVAPVHLEGHPRIGQREARPRENGREDPCEDDVSELRSWPGKGNPDPRLAVKTGPSSMILVFRIAPTRFSRPASLNNDESMFSCFFYEVIVKPTLNY